MILRGFFFTLQNGALGFLLVLCLEYYPQTESQICSHKIQKQRKTDIYELLPDDCLILFQSKSASAKEVFCRRCLNYPQEVCLQQNKAGRSFTVTLKYFNRTKNFQLSYFCKLNVASDITTIHRIKYS